MIVSIYAVNTLYLHGSSQNDIRSELEVFLFLCVSNGTCVKSSFSMRTKL